MAEFEHKRLDAYKVSLRFAIRIDPVVDSLPPGRGYLADQLRRAAASIPLNVAEGCGEFSPREKARFYRMARRSATESAAIIDLLGGFGAVEARIAQRAENMLGRIVAMLTAMILRLDAGARSRSSSASPSTPRSRSKPDSDPSAGSGARADSRSGSGSTSAPAAPRSEPAG